MVDGIYHRLCLALGRLLSSAKYSTAIVQPAVRKSRRFYAPLLVWMGGPLMRVLDTGVRVLPQPEWHERERLIYETLYRTSIRIDADGTLVLPCLAGRTLATLLEDPAVEESVRQQAIRLAAIALAEFHHLGFTHGDAMAENVLIDIEGGVARWFDFETVHDMARPLTWRRADDLRALLVTCLVRTPPRQVAGNLALILNVYENEEITRHLATCFSSVWRRPLSFHLAQAALSFQSFREIGGLLRERLVDARPTLT